MRDMAKIEFEFKGKKRIHEFMFGIKEGVNGFGLKDERGIWHDCLYKDNEVKIYGQDSDYLEERSYAKVI